MASCKQGDIYQWIKLSSPFLRKVERNIESREHIERRMPFKFSFRTKSIVQRLFSFTRSPHCTEYFKLVAKWPRCVCTSKVNSRRERRDDIIGRVNACSIRGNSCHWWSTFGARRKWRTLEGLKVREFIILRERRNELESWRSKSVFHSFSFFFLLLSFSFSSTLGLTETTRKLLIRRAFRDERAERIPRLFNWNVTKWNSSRHGALIEPERYPGHNDKHAAGNVDLNKIVTEFPLEQQVNFQATVLSCKKKSRSNLSVRLLRTVSPRYLQSSINDVEEGREFR